MLSETFEKNELETLMPTKTTGRNNINKSRWSKYRLPLSMKRDNVIIMPMLNTLLRDGLNS